MKKKIIILGICLLIIISAVSYLGFKQYQSAKIEKEKEAQVLLDQQQNTSNIVSVAQINKTNVTDVFYGFFQYQIEDKGSTIEPGQRFTVKVEKDKKYPQIGNATGVVIVDYPTANYKSGDRPSPQYIFYTEYDPHNYWYKILKLKAVNLNSGGDQ